MRAARAAGLTVEVRVPTYEHTTWCGHPSQNPQVYPGWVTPEAHPAVEAAVESYRSVVTPCVEERGGRAEGGALRKEPRTGHWIFSTDGVGYPLPRRDTHLSIAESKRWIEAGDLVHPAMIGIGPGLEQNTHRIGECVDVRELRHAIALLARFPSAYVAATA